LTRILTIVPVHNEAENIRKVIAELQRDLPDADILVVDDGSTDITPDILRGCRIPALDLPRHQGYSAALQAGFRYAVKKGYDYIIQFDGDGQHIALEARKLVATIIREKADIVIGSRFMEKSGYAHPFCRRVGTWLFRTLFYRICRLRITDPTSGFQVLAAPVFTRYAGMKNFPRYPDTNLLIEMVLIHRYRLLEVPVCMRMRASGKSMHRGILRPIRYLIEMFYSILLVILDYRIRGRFLRKKIRG